MGGSYIQCSECGKRALSIATRCPGCGRELPPRPERRAGRTIDVGRILPLPLVAVVLLAGTMLASAALRRASRAPSAEESSAVMAGAREESASIAAATRLDTARLPAAPKASAAELRVARTWTKVRNRRSTTGEIEAVLLPGDTVAVDSLSRGWWRVALEGEVLGYVHQSTLVAEGSPAVQ